MIRPKFHPFDTCKTPSTLTTAINPQKRRHSAESASDILRTKININTGILHMNNSAFTVIPNGRISFEGLHGCNKITLEKLQKLQMINYEPLDPEKQKNKSQDVNVHRKMIKETFNSSDGSQTSRNVMENSNICSQLPEAGCKKTKLIIKISEDDRTVPSHITIKTDEEAKKDETINKILDVKKRLATISMKIKSGISSRELFNLLRAEKEKLEKIRSEMKANYEDAVKRGLIKKIDMSKGPCNSMDQFLCLEENLNDDTSMSELVDILICEISTNVMTIEQALDIVIKRIMIQDVAESIQDLNNETFISQLKNIRQAVLRAMRTHFLETDSSVVIKLWNERWLSN